MSSSTNAKLNIDGQWGAVPRGMTKLLDAAHFKTYCALACFAANDTRQCYPSMRKLTEDTGSNRSTVNQHIKTLCAIGAITKLQTGGYRRDGGNEANTYRINGCEAVLAATGLTEAMLERIKPTDVSWVVKARAGCEVPQRCPSERTLQEELCGRAAAYSFAFPSPEEQVVATEASGGVASEATGVVATEADTTAHITAQLTTHLTAQSVTGYTNSLIEDSYGAEGECVKSHSDSNEPLGFEDVFVSDVSSVSHTPEGRDPAQAGITSPASGSQSVSVNDRFVSETQAPAADSEQWAHARELVTYAKGPYEVDVALLAKVPICYQGDICNALAERDLGYIDDPMKAAGIATEDDVLDAMSGVNVVLPEAPLWFIAVCKELGLSITATEASSEAA